MSDYVPPCFLWVSNQKVLKCQTPCPPNANSYSLVDKKTSLRGQQTIDSRLRDPRCLAVGARLRNLGIQILQTP